MYSFLVHRSSDIQQPSYFCSFTSTFHACQACLETHEWRFCNGDTKPVWTLCDVHQVVDGKEDISVDLGMLDWLREEVWKGRIKKPQIPKPAKSFADGAARGKGFCSGWKAQMVAAIITEDIVDANPLRDVDQHDRGASAFGMESTGYFPDSNTMGVNGQMLPQSCENMTNDDQDIASQANLWPKTLVTYSHAKGCLHSELPSVKIIRGQILQTSSFHGDDEIVKQARWVEGARDCPSSMIGTGAKLSLDDTAHFDVEDGIYFKRCNGVYADLRHRVLVADVEEVLKHRIPQQAKHASLFECKGSHSTENEWKEAESTITETNQPELGLLINDSINLSAQYDSQSDNSTVSPVKTSRTDSAVSFLDQLGSITTSKSISATTVTSPSSQTPALSSSLPKTQNPKIPTSYLLSRSHLVHIGSIPDEDLIITCWLLHNQGDVS